MIPGYHDLYVTTETIPRTQLFDLPFGYSVHCCRVTGWELHHYNDDGFTAVVAGEYDGRWLRLDVGGFVIVDSSGRETEAVQT